MFAEKVRGGATFGFVLLVMVVFFMAACGGSGRSMSPNELPRIGDSPPIAVSPDAAGPPSEAKLVETAGAGTGTGTGGGDELLDEGEELGQYPPMEEWVEPDYGRTIMIASDSVIVALEGSWEQPAPEDLPVDIAPLDEAFENHATVQALINNGYELMATWGEVNGGLFALPEGVSVTQAMAQIAASPQTYPDVWKVYPEAIIELCAMPNDPDFDDQWNFDDGENFDVDAPEGWDEETGSYSTIVAVMDTGVVRACFPNRVTGYGGWVDRTNARWEVGGGQPIVGSADWQHGTAVASVIAAPTNDDQDIAGAMWECKVFPVRMNVWTTAAEFHAYRVIAATKGILWDSRIGMKQLRPPQVYSGIKSVNYSGGCKTPHFLGIKFIYRYLGAYTVFACAAGNDATWMPFYPAANKVYSFPLPDLTVGVAGYDTDGHLTWDSETGEGTNYGQYNCDVAAPGSAVSVFWPLNLQQRNVVSAYGTSFASPHVAAMAALRGALYPNEAAINTLNRVMFASRKYSPALTSPYFPLEHNEMMPIQCSYYNCLVAP